MSWRPVRVTVTVTFIVMICAVLAETLLPAVHVANAQATDQQRLQGTWECIATLRDGKQVRDYVGVRAVIEDNRLTWHFPQADGSERVVKATFAIDPSQNPKHFDWYPEGGGRSHHRLYILEGDTLIWSDDLGNAPRPAHFNAGRWQFVTRRVKG